MLIQLLGLFILLSTVFAGKRHLRVVHLRGSVSSWYLLNSDWWFNRGRGEIKDDIFFGGLKVHDLWKILILNIYGSSGKLFCKTQFWHIIDKK